MNETDHIHMRHALALGARGQGTCWPNPSVGCVIVKSCRIVGRGWTQAGGIPHAETVALAQAGAAAKDATAYVTLEPCAHHGRTPPCANTLVAAGISRAVIAMTDPDPRVDGKGIAILRAAGVEVVTGVLQNAAQASHAGFLSRVTLGRPRVTLKLATSLDGRIATASGESQWITGTGARRAVHALRARHDAVMVGAGTVRSDNPTLNVRDMGHLDQPVRVVWSRHLDLPLHSTLAQTARDIPLWIMHADTVNPDIQTAWQGLGARLFACLTDVRRHLAPDSVLTALGKAGLNNVLCEGGGELAASLLSAGQVDELVVFQAGTCLGGDGLAAIQAMAINRLDAAPRFGLLESRAIGGDIMSRWVKH